MQKIIIIGASSGIGKALATVYLDDGHTVGISARRISLLEEISYSYPGRVHVAQMDLVDIPQSITAMDNLLTEMGGADIIILSSGTGDINPGLDFEKEKNTIDLNVSGFTAMIGHCYHYFETRGTGHLVALSSVAGLRGTRIAPAYNASKAYQINYLEGLRQKAFRSGNKIIITDIRPGLVDTNMAKGEGLFWVAPPAKAAKQIRDAIRRNKKHKYITRRWAIIAAILKLLPPSLHKRM